MTSATRRIRRIVVTSNCQLGGLFAALSAMLPEDDLVAIPDLGGDPAELLSALPTADVWVSSMAPQRARELLTESGATAELISIPLILFTGFHPDIVHPTTVGGIELASAVGGYSSAVVVWGWLNGWSVDQTVASFNPSVLTRLGYMSAWDGGVRLARYVFEQANCDFDGWFLPLVAAGRTFMLTDNHPTVEALIQLARVVAVRLEADHELVSYRWETVIPDGLLSTSAVWPVYPPIGACLDLPGAYVWRRTDGELINLEAFIAGSFQAYSEVDPATVTVGRFENDPRVARALGGSFEAPPLNLAGERGQGHG